MFTIFTVARYETAEVLQHVENQIMIVCLSLGFV